MGTGIAGECPFCGRRLSRHNLAMIDDVFLCFACLKKRTGKWPTWDGAGMLHLAKEFGEIAKEIASDNGASP